MPRTFAYILSYKFSQGAADELFQASFELIFFIGDDFHFNTIIGQHTQHLLRINKGFASIIQFDETETFRCRPDSPLKELALRANSGFELGKLLQRVFIEHGISLLTKEKEAGIIAGFTCRRYCDCRIQRFCRLISDLPELTRFIKSARVVFALLLMAQLCRTREPLKNVYGEEMARQILFKKRSLLV